ncbi:hypothetical protein IFM89_032395 [Coptis chinensis]|uniref:Uncharacterized protein n=1 Tax=Coptis chinensis TaxID=261450 RepID=A0A835HZE3_9MAGN|nr:hypothetical protein IFM89_032395 [Coptis chinensis]
MHSYALKARYIQRGADSPRTVTHFDPVFSIDMGRLLVGTNYRGDFEEWLMGVVDEVRESNGAIILFIEEVHTLIGAGGYNASSAANIF